MLIYDVFHSISLKYRDESHFYPVLNYSVILVGLITTYSGSLYFPVLRPQNFIQEKRSCCHSVILALEEWLQKYYIVSAQKNSEILGL